MNLEIFTIIYRAPEDEYDYTSGKTSYITKTEKDAVIDTVLDFQHDRRTKIERIFSVNEYGRELKHYDVIWKNFRLELEEVKN